VTSGQTVAVKPKQIRLVHQVYSKKWQAHYKFENFKMWFRRCTDTANVKEAIKIAERLWMKAAFDFLRGQPSDQQELQAHGLRGARPHERCDCSRNGQTVHTGTYIYAWVLALPGALALH